MERNVIQNPEILAALARFLGLRQESVTPELLEGLQGVVIVGDARDGVGPASPAAPIVRRYNASAWGTVGINLDTFIGWFNAPGAQRRAIYKLRRMRVMVDTAAGALVRVRMGPRDAAIGGVYAGGIGYPDRVATPAPPFAVNLVSQIGNAATNTGFLTQVQHEYIVGPNTPILLDEGHGISLTEGAGWYVQTFGVAAGIGLAITSTWDEVSVS
jgi:hypothetical protein